MASLRNFGKKKEVDVTRVPGDISGTFFGASIPDDVKLVVPLLHDKSSPVATTEVVRSCIARVIEYLKTGGAADAAGADADAEFVLWQRELGQQASGELLGCVFSGVYSILRAAISCKVNTARIVADLKRMNVPVSVADDLGQAILRSRSQLEKTALRSFRRTKLEILRWRIDVVISSGSLSRVMRPSILMQMILSDGRIHTFEVSQEQFNQIRYGVAMVLREMQLIERHPIMKVAKELQKREDAERK